MNEPVGTVHKRAAPKIGDRLFTRTALGGEVFDQLPIGLVLAEAPGGRIVVYNQEAERLLGHPLIDVEDRAEYARYGAIHEDGTPYGADDHPLARALKGEASQDVTVWYRRGDGERIRLRVNASPMWAADGRLIGAVTTFADVTGLQAEAERKRELLEALVAERTHELSVRNEELDRVNEELRRLSEGLEEEVRRRTAELAHLAHHDHLTGLPNRRVLEERLEQALALAARHGRSLAVLFLDIDGFKSVNDTLGHSVGDEVLKQIGVRLSSSLRSTDTLARISGDEFVVLVSEIEGPEDAHEVGEVMRACFVEPFEVLGRRLRLTASVGVSVYPTDASTAPELQRHADTAMYRAKDRGKDRIVLFRDPAELAPSGGGAAGAS
jgi:diguanylate cyclase (GGDEF)-like protein/PAS domain S-box-containing protein